MVGYIDMQYPATVVAEYDENNIDGRNPTILAWNHETSAQPAAAAVPDFQVLTHAGCECSIEAFRG